MNLLSALVGLASLVCVRASTCETPLDVKTTSGEVVGFVNSTAPSVRQFLGVPYAEPPLGCLRFQPPVRKTHAGRIQATTYAPSCMQRISNSPTVYTEYMPEFLINGGNSEDCLYLNVYAPAQSHKLPVFIYIPGGGFTGGGADSLYKIPDKWIERTQSHIVITMNYRLNVFGYPNAKAAHENVGLLDQRMVVEWARDNIAAFGGDPDRMVLWGQSAGAASVGMYGYAYPDDLIVTGLISDSGSPSTLSKEYGNHTDFDTLADLLGCHEEASRLACMQDVDAQELETVYSNTASVSFSPVADNVTVFSNTEDRLARGLVTRVPWIMGNNANEGAGFGTFNASGESPEQFQIGLSQIACPVAAEIRNRARFGYPTYRYYYAGNFSNISPLPWIGATHSAELPLLFGTHYEYRGNSTEFEWEVSYGMEALWLSFARDPEADPTDGVVTWPRYEPEQDTMAIFAAEKWVEFGSESVNDNLCELGEAS